MFLKLAIIALAAFNTASAGDDVWTGFVASWSSNSSSHFYQLPQTLESAQNQGWTNISGVEQPDNITALGYYGDYRLVVLYSGETGAACGVQIAIPTEDVDNTGEPMIYANISAITTKVLEGVSCYTVTAYFSIDESSGSRRIWFQEKNSLHEIPTNISEVTSKTEFYAGSCVPTMGNHYNNMNSTSDCSYLYPWFLLGYGDNVIGFGFQGFGSGTSSSKRTWWETIPPASLAYVVRDPPTCAVNAIYEYGVISLHIWLIDTPQDITCS
ncbi:uncharacterized protein LOC124308757 [Neodiprion virginianus]|uniref:Uncharacterized protein LOC107225026 n=1 Tax=Neodiprion lecontei TaxID=441921 RepID=A0A6J0C2T2_NEOLC|nr:uncharacterized protein LOC107225026 [Neodiprion lecontei]XP_046627729.1 uncharacterized protein LOC124308757 [Neodiprion virginianus]